MLLHAFVGPGATVVRFAPEVGKPSGGADRDDDNTEPEGHGDGIAWRRWRKPKPLALRTVAQQPPREAARRALRVREGSAGKKGRAGRGNVACRFFYEVR
jgi:hypothetical protein